MEAIPAEESEEPTGELASTSTEDIKLDTHVGPISLMYERGVKIRAAFTPYNEKGEYSTPSVLSNLSRQMYEWGFQVTVGKPPIVVWNNTFRESDEYETLREDKIKLRLAQAAKTMPSNGRYGRVDTSIDGFSLPRDFARSFLNTAMPKAVMVQFDGETEVTAYAMEYHSRSEDVETHIEGEYEEEITVGIRVHAFTNLHCYTQKHYKSLCDRVLNRSWDDAVEVLLQMNEVESSVLIDDSLEEITL